jgi:hypothetical protein
MPLESIKTGHLATLGILATLPLKKKDRAASAVFPFLVHLLSTICGG